MKHRISILLSIALTMTIVFPVRAVTISAEPQSPAVQVGNTVSVDLTLSGLGNFTSPSLGAYQFGLLYDASVLNYGGSLTFTSYLGDPDPGVFETDISVTESVIGQIDFSVLSYLLDTELDALQPSNFPLVSIQFSGKNAGTSLLSFTGVVLTDALGTTLSGIIQQSGTVQVTPANKVLIPGTLVLLLVALPFVKRRT